MEEGKRVTTESRHPIGFAHRGARAHAPENTLPAFALALEMGACALESDVWLTADGIAVLDHDGLVDGVKIENVPAAALPSHIPRLSDLYRECGTRFELSLDVKDGRSAVEVLRVAQAANAVPRLWLCHWNWKVLLPWREASPAVRLVDSTSTTHMRTPVPERAARMRRLGIDALNLHASEWRPELVAQMHAEGRLAFAWDLQQESDLRASLTLGVDAVYSDHVDRMLRALASDVPAAERAAAAVADAPGGVPGRPR
jgi:glycerophosphoryl diester phosphodiesterase